MARARAEPSREPPALVVVAGGVASGKSTLSRALARELRAERLEADRIRGTLLASTESDPAGAEARWRRDLSAGFEAEIYADLLRRAGALLERGRSVVLDACFPRRSQREAMRTLAVRCGARLLVAECRVAPETLRARLAERDRRAGRAGWETLQRRLADAWEPLDELAGREHLVVACEGPVEPAVATIAARLRATPVAPRATVAGLQPVPRAVSFDCWNTLLVEQDWPWAHALRVMALRDAAREAGRDVSQAAAATAFDAAWGRHVELWQQGQASGAPEIARWGLAALGLPDPHPALEHLVRRYEEASHTSHVVALEGAKRLLAGLEAAGTACVLVCDTGLTPGRVVRRLLARVGLLEHLRALAFSDEVGAPKPDPRAFLAALEPVGISPHEAVHVGDLRRTDVAGARNLGMRSVRIRAPHDDTSELPEADHVVSSHSELAALLGLERGEPASAGAAPGGG